MYVKARVKFKNRRWRRLWVDKQQLWKRRMRWKKEQALAGGFQIQTEENTQQHGRSNDIKISMLESHPGQLQWQKWSSFSLVLVEWQCRDHWLSYTYFYSLKISKWKLGLTTPFLEEPCEALQNSFSLSNSVFCKSSAHTHGPLCTYTWLMRYTVLPMVPHYSSDLKVVIMHQ